MVPTNPKEARRLVRMAAQKFAVELKRFKGNTGLGKQRRAELHKLTAGLISRLQDQELNRL